MRRGNNNVNRSNNNSVYKRTERERERSSKHCLWGARLVNGFVPHLSLTVLRRLSVGLTVGVCALWISFHITPQLRLLHWVRRRAVPRALRWWGTQILRCWVLACRGIRTLIIMITTDGLLCSALLWSTQTNGAYNKRSPTVSALDEINVNYQR